MNTEAIEELEKEIRSSEQQLVMFSLEWCEFCWAAIKVLDEYEIPYRVTNLDSVAYVDNLRGRNIRLALNEKTKAVIYINSANLILVMNLNRAFETCRNE